MGIYGNYQIYAISGLRAFYLPLYADLGYWAYQNIGILSKMRTPKNCHFSTFKYLFLPFCYLRVCNRVFLRFTIFQNTHFGNPSHRDFCLPLYAEFGTLGMANLLTSAIRGIWDYGHFLKNGYFGI